MKYCRYEQHYDQPESGNRRYRRVARKRDTGGFQRKILSVAEEKINSEPLTSIDEPISYETSCIRPEYMVFTWILCLVALASALKLYYLIKTALAAVIVLVYAVLILIVCKDMFSEERNA